MTSRTLSTLALSPLDSWRGKVLRLTLRVPLLQRIFVNRADRLLYQFLLTATVAGGLSAVFPLEMVLAGPLIFGAAHLFSGARYLPQLLHRPTRSGAVWYCLLLLACAASRMITLGDLPNLPELACLMLFAVALRLPLLRFGPALLLLGVATHLGGALTLGGIALAHNAMAFLFWIRSTHTRRERRTAMLALGLFIAVSTAVFLWPMSVVYDPAIDDLARGIFPDFVSSAWARRILVAYAFGQSMHYFVWLRAIPEQRAHQQIPLSFRRSLVALRRDLGPRLTLLTVLLTPALGLALGWVSATELRALYLTVASAHGYLEFAALAPSGGAR